MYLRNPVYQPYVGTVGTSILKEIQRMAAEDTWIRFDMGDDESLDDYCVSVSVKRDLPSDLEIVDKQGDVRVFYVPGGNAIAYAKSTEIDATVQ